MKVAYLGPVGTYSEQAAKLFAQKTDQLLPYATIFEVIYAIQCGEVDYAVAPIENSVEGSVNTTLDFLAKKDCKLFIAREIDLAINNVLMVLPGVQKSKIEVILSHPQPLAQCQHFIHKNFRQVKTFPTNSTADAVRKIKNENLLHYAAIGSENLARAEGMQIVAKGISDSQENVTRFVVLSAKEDRHPKQNKSSFVFSCLKDKPGGLYEILGFLAKDKINMTKIESRPNKSLLGEYVFFIDIEGSVQDNKIKKVLTEIEKSSSYFKFLGSYQRSTGC